MNNYLIRLLSLFALFISSTKLIATEPPVLQIAMPSEHITNFFPIRQSPGQSHFVRSLVNPPVIHMDSSWNWKCLLCEEIPSVANGKVRINNKAKFPFQTEWRLRSDLRWADGSRLTAEDVKKTMGIIFRQSREGPVPTLPLFKVDVHPKDQQRFYISFQEPRFDFHQIMAVSLLPAHKIKNLQAKLEEGEDLEHLITKNPRLLDSRSWYYGNYYVESLRSQEIKLTPNPRFFQGNPQGLPHINIVIKRNSAEMRQAVQTGTIDMVVENSISLGEALSILDKQNSNHAPYRLLSSPSSKLDQLIINLRNPYLSDVKIRQALMIAIDRDQALESAYQNHGAAAYQLLPPIEPQPSSMRMYPFNPDRAAALLDSLGWKLEDGGKRYRHGQKLELQLVTADQPEHLAMAKIIQKNWQDIGIKTEVMQYTATEFHSRILPTRRFRDVALVSLNHTPSSYWFGRYDSRNIPRPNNSLEGANYGSLQSRQIDSLLASYRQTFNPEELRRKETKIIQKIYQYAPTIPLVFQPKLVLIRDSINNLTISGHQFHSSLLSPEWTSTAIEREVF